MKKKSTGYKIGDIVPPAKRHLYVVDRDGRYMGHLHDARFTKEELEARQERARWGTQVPPGGYKYEYVNGRARPVRITPKFRKLR